jgi:hypothetical protein
MRANLPAARNHFIERRRARVEAVWRSAGGRGTIEAQIFHVFLGQNPPVHKELCVATRRRSSVSGKSGSVGTTCGICEPGVCPILKKRALYIVKEATPSFKRATRNFREKIAVKEVSDFTAYDVMQRGKLVIDEAAIELIEKRLAVTAKEKSNEA